MGVQALVSIKCDICSNPIAKTDGVTASDQFNKIFHSNPCWEDFKSANVGCLAVLGVDARFVSISYDQLIQRLSNSKNIQIVFP